MSDIKVICPSCKAENPQGKKFCLKCGGKLPVENTNSVVICPSCKAENPQGKKFCMKCGSKLSAENNSGIIICPSCKSENPQDKKFCMKCGTALTPVGSKPSADKPAVKREPPKAKAEPVKKIQKQPSGNVKKLSPKLLAVIAAAVVVIAGGIIGVTKYNTEEVPYVAVKVFGTTEANTEKLSISQKNLKNVDLAAALEPFTNLKSLIIYDCSNCNFSMDMIKNVEGLEELSLQCTIVTDITGIDKFTNLKSLNLCATDITSLAGIEKLSKLEHLDISLLHDIDDLSPLAGLTELKELKMAFIGVNKESIDISPIYGLGKLEYLDISSLNTSDLSPLAALISLKELEMGGINSINALGDREYKEFIDISSIYGLSGLETLNMSDDYINDRDFLKKMSGLTSLKSLEISGVYIGTEYDDYLNDLTPIIT